MTDPKTDPDEPVEEDETPTISDVTDTTTIEVEPEP